MRRSLGKSTIIGHATRTHPLFSSGYSSSSFGRGGGRGRGSPLSSSDLDNLIVPGSSSRKSDDDDSKDEEAPFSPSPGIGHGRGKPFPSSTPNLPSFSSPPPLPSGSPSPGPTNSSGRGRGTILEGGPKKPIFFLKEDFDSAQKAPIGAGRIRNPESSSNLPSSILDVLLSTSGAGRGKPMSPPAPAGEKVTEENRHLRAKQSGRGRSGSPAGAGAVRLSPEEARKKAMGILSRGGGGVAEEEEGRERVGGERGGRGFRGRGGGGTRGGRGGRFGGGRGMQSSWRGRGRGGRGRGRGRGQDSEEDDYGSGLYLGDDADGEKLAAKLGPENMNKLVEGFEEMSGSVLPSPMEDALVDALHTNYMIECEPEYLMEEFGTNPDIDEKPPIPLRDALEKVKPFLMAYEGIQSQEEWEEVMKETMEQVPLMKEIVDYYSGPDRVTAKRQQEELERVAKTLPDSAPTSVKRFTDRALLSLQSNPGWGFDKKCQFMDKLVWEVSQHYK